MQHTCIYINTDIRHIKRNRHGNVACVDSLSTACRRVKTTLGTSVSSNGMQSGVAEFYFQNLVEPSRRFRWQDRVV
jgi:hypothetical protein